MKILIAKHKHGVRLVTEMKMAGLDPIPFMYTKRTRNRKANKIVLRDVWVIPGMIFCETDNLNFRWIQKVWTRDDEYVEIKREEIDHFLRQMRPRTLEVGAEIVLEDGPFAGLRVKVTQILSKKFRGLLIGGGGGHLYLEIPI